MILYIIDCCEFATVAENERRGRVQKHRFQQSYFDFVDVLLSDGTEFEPRTLRSAHGRRCVTRWRRSVNNARESVTRFCVGRINSTRNLFSMFTNNLISSQRRVIFLLFFFSVIFTRTSRLSVLLNRRLRYCWTISIYKIYISRQYSRKKYRT